MSKPEAGHHRWHQHGHLRVGDGHVQGEGQVPDAQTGEHNRLIIILFKVKEVTREVIKSVFLSQALLGHTDAVTCMTASSAYRIVVSGSRDRTCIIWDLNKLSFVTQLRGHRAPVSALCINELTVGRS